MVQKGYCCGGHYCSTHLTITISKAVPNYAVCLTLRYLLYRMNVVDLFNVP